MSVAAIVLAAGAGLRAGQSEGPKQFRRIGGRSVIAHSTRAFTDYPGITHVVVVTGADSRSICEDALGQLVGMVRIIDGGPTRQASTLNGLESLLTEQPDVVLIHDAARPFVDAALIDRVLAGVAEHDSVLPALPVSDTLKRCDPDRGVLQTVPRSDLQAAQTPQGFRFPEILDAHRRAKAEPEIEFTDDASIAAWAGLPVHTVEGDARNVKLTWEHDLTVADKLMTPAAIPDVRTGNGYDVHAFEEGDAVVLCGVAIPHNRKLSGHSDADVGLHALTDALLATCSAGDIGTHFPPSDPQWRGAASRLFAEHAVALVGARGGIITHADVTLICEAPKIGPHRQTMLEAMANMLKIDTSRVSVKATTNERLGFIGRQEGIAAIATATVVFPGGVA